MRPLLCTGVSKQSYHARSGRKEGVSLAPGPGRALGLSRLRGCRRDRLYPHLRVWQLELATSVVDVETGFGFQQLLLRAFRHRVAFHHLAFRARLYLACLPDEISTAHAPAHIARQLAVAALRAVANPRRRNTHVTESIALIEVTKAVADWAGLRIAVARTA